MCREWRNIPTRFHEFSRLGSKVAPNTSQNVHCQSKLERGKCKMHRHQRIGMHNGNNCFFDEECVKGSSKEFKTPTTKFAIAFQFVRCEKHFQLFSVSDIWQGTSTSNPPLSLAWTTCFCDGESDGLVFNLLLAVMAAVTWGSSSVTDNDDRAAADDIEVHDDNVDDDCDDIVTIAGEYSSPSVIVPLSDDSLLPALPMEPPPASRSKKLREKITIPNHDDKRFWTPSSKATHSSYPQCWSLGSEVPPSVCC